jgi:hypothetical protein
MSARSAFGGKADVASTFWLLLGGPQAQSSMGPRLPPGGGPGRLPVATNTLKRLLATRLAPLTSPKAYRRRARHILQMAQTCQDPQIADRLRVISADYFDAGQGGAQTFQQQVQPDKDAE